MGDRKDRTASPPGHPIPACPTSQQLLLSSISRIPSRKPRARVCVCVCVCVCVYHSGWLNLQCRRLGFDPWVQSLPGSGRAPGEGNSFPLQYSFLENSMDRGAWRSIVHGVVKCVWVWMCVWVCLWMCTAAFNTDTKVLTQNTLFQMWFSFLVFWSPFSISTVSSIPFFSMAPWDGILCVCYGLFDLDR